MTNDQVKQFFRDNGAYYELDVVNTPVFQHYYIIHNTKTNGLQLMNKTCAVDNISVVDIQFFILKHMNNMNKWYIYNDMNTDFNMNMKYIRAKEVETDDYIKLRRRAEKINKIKEIINTK